MAYTVYSGERCVRVAVDNGRCALTDGHHGLHTTAAGGRFSTQGGKYLSGDPLLATRSVVGQKVTVENATQVAASLLEQRVDAVVQRVESETPLREALASRLDQLTNKLNQEQHNRHRLADQVTALMNRVTALERDYVDPARANGLLDSIHKLDTALVDMRTDLNREKKAREALTVENISESVAAVLEQRIDVLREATLMNVEQLSERIRILEQGIDAVERQLAGGTLENHRVRLERLERELRDTHDLAERAATAHLERKPEQWNADSDEPSRLCRYQDSCGYVWEYSSSRYGWHWEKNPGNLRKLVGPFIPWDGLRCDPRADFPWKVWTNG